MNMVLVEIAIVNILLMIAMICEKKTGNIPPVIGWIGCVAGIVCSVVGEAICSWQMDLIAYVVSYVIIMIIYTACHNLLGGGILKMMAMTAVYFGPYTVIVFGVTMVGLSLFVIIAGQLIKCIPFIAERYHEKQVLAMPFVFVGSIVTSAFLYFGF